MDILKKDGGGEAVGEGVWVVTGLRVVGEIVSGHLCNSGKQELI